MKTLKVWDLNQVIVKILKMKKMMQPKNHMWTYHKNLVNKVVKKSLVNNNSPFNSSTYSGGVSQSYEQVKVILWRNLVKHISHVSSLIKKNAKVKKKYCITHESIVSKMQEVFEVLVAGIKDLKTHNIQPNAKLDILYQNRL